MTSPSAQLSAALASHVAVRSKRKGQVKAALVTATSADLRFDFDAQGAEPFRILIRSADKHGICVFNLALSHRGHVPQTESQPTQPKPKHAHKAKQTDAVPAFEVLENEGVMAPAQRENGPVARGTVNPGNFCYANATLVALAHIRPLVESVFSQALPGPTSPVARRFALTIRALVKGNDALDLALFHQAALLSADRLRPHFAQREQEDAQEFLTALFASIDNSTMGSALRDQLQIGTRETIRCTSCPRTTSQPVPALCLQVAIKVSSLPAEYKYEVPLSHLVDEHFKPEFVESSCHGAVNALRRHSLTISHHPPFMVLIIKRFRYSDLFDMTTKLDFMVRINDTLPVQTARYRLLSVVMHHGNSSHAGHYTTFALNENSNEWFVYDNDQQPRKVDFKKFTATVRFKRDCYIFICKLIKSAARDSTDSDEEKEA